MNFTENLPNTVKNANNNLSMARGLISIYLGITY